jgi:hypothetical protein
MCRPFRPEKILETISPGPALAMLAPAQAVTLRSFSPADEYAGLTIARLPKRAIAGFSDVSDANREGAVRYTVFPGGQWRVCSPGLRNMRLRASR